MNFSKSRDAKLHAMLCANNQLFSMTRKYSRNARQIQAKDQAAKIFDRALDARGIKSSNAHKISELAKNGKSKNCN